MIMRKLIVLFACLVSVTLVTQTAASADTYLIKGRVLSTYSAAGGEPVFGDPLALEVKQSLSGRNLYSQRFERGLVFWSSYAGGKTAIYPNMLSLSGVSNERDALARYGFRPGMVFRSANLCGATSKDKQLVSAQLAGGTLIDLRTSGTCSEPTLAPGITKVRYSITSSAARDYRRYVTDSAIRSSVGKALKAILADARAGKPSWVHCTAGKDRTGWTITVLLALLGADQGDIYAEYLRSGSVDEADLVLALDTMAERYPGADWHGTSFAGAYGYALATGLSDSDIDGLRAALG